MGVDLGTSFTEAAVNDDGRPQIVTLGDHSIANGAKQYLGDPNPLMSGGYPQSAVTLMATALNTVVDTVAAIKGAPPDRVVLTHPAVWGQHRREQFHEVRRESGLDAVNILTEPAAAATHYAGRRRLPEGSTVAVYDLGGGTFDATVVRLSDAGAEVIGVPQGLEWIGGNAFDEAVLNFVDHTLDGVISGLDPVDPNTATARHQLRMACRKAKERLSQDELAAISFSLPGRRPSGRRSDVRLSRSEFEDMIRSSVQDTVGALQRAMDSAEQTVNDLSGLLVIGGSAQIPLVSRMLSEALGRPITVDPEAQTCVALGAAALSRPQPLSFRAMTKTVPPTPTPPVGVWPVPSQAARAPSYSPVGAAESHGPTSSEAITTLLPAMPLPEAEPLPETGPDTGELALARSLPDPVDFSDPDSFPDPGTAPKTGRGSDRRRIWLLVAAASVLILAGAGIFTILNQDDDAGTSQASGPEWATGAPLPGGAADGDPNVGAATSSPGKSPKPTTSASKSPTPSASTSVRPTSPTAAPTTTRGSAGGGQGPGPSEGTQTTTPAPSATTTAPAAPGGPTSSVRYCNSIAGTRMTLTAGGAAQGSGDCGTTEVSDGGDFQITITRISDGAVKSSQVFTQSDLSGTARARGSFGSPQFAYGFLS